MAAGEISSILVRGIFSILVSLCDVLASISCCWRVPYDERPDRQTYTFNTLAEPLESPRPSLLTRKGRELRKQQRQQKSAADKERKLRILEEKHTKDLADREEKDQKKVEKEAEKQRKIDEKVQKKEDDLREMKESSDRAADEKKAALVGKKSAETSIND